MMEKGIIKYEGDTESLRSNAEIQQRYLPV